MMAAVEVKLVRYRQIIKRLVGRIAAIPVSQPGIEMLCALDEERDQYLLLTTGWRGNDRQWGVHLHVRICDGKFWIETDMLEEGITPGLLEAGVPREDVVLAF